MHHAAVDERRRPQFIPVAEVGDNPLERRQVTHRRQGDGRVADVPWESPEEEVADHLHELPLGAHLAHLGPPAVHRQATAQVVAGDGGSVPAAIVHRRVPFHRRLGAVHAEAQPQPTAGQRQQQEVAVAAVVQVEQHAVWSRCLEAEGQVTPGTGVPAQVAGPLALGAGEVQAQDAAQQQQEEEENEDAVAKRAVVIHRESRRGGAARGGQLNCACVRVWWWGVYILKASVRRGYSRIPGLSGYNGYIPTGSFTVEGLEYVAATVATFLTCFSLYATCHVQTLLHFLQSSYAQSRWLLPHQHFSAM